MATGNWLSVVLEFVQVMLLPVALLAFTVSIVIVVAGWRGRRDLLLRRGRNGTEYRFELGQTPFASGLLDVAAEADAVLRQFAGQAAQNFVGLELAVQPRLAVRADSRVLREILGDLVAHAIAQSPCGRVLLGAARHGGRVQITVSDDGPGADRGSQASELRSAERLAALQGATMDIDARAGQGTTIVLRLPTSGTARRDATVTEPADPASVWSSPSAGARETSGAAR